MREALATSGACVGEIRADRLAGVLLPGEVAVGFLRHQPPGASSEYLLAHVLPAGGHPVRVDLGPVDDYNTVYDGRVISIDPASGAQTLVASGGLLLNPRSIAVGPSGNLYVLNQLGPTMSGLDQLVTINPGSGVQTLLVSNFVDPSTPHEIQTDGLGRLLISASGGPVGGIFEVDPFTGLTTRISDSLMAGVSNPATAAFAFFVEA